MVTADYRVLSEYDLILKGRGILRPDRVVFMEDHLEVIDFKFGLRETEVHHRQVREYMKALTEIEVSRPWVSSGMLPWDRSGR